MNTYSTAVSDGADADLDRIASRLLGISVDAALDWQTGFEAALASLTSLPNRCPKARDGSRYPGVVARQLYFGKYRLVFHVIKAADDETEGTVIILRVLYGTQSMEQKPQGEG